MDILVITDKFDEQIFFRVPTRCRLNVGTVPTRCKLNVGTVPTRCRLNVGTVPTIKLSQTFMYILNVLLLVLIRKIETLLDTNSAGKTVLIEVSTFNFLKVYLVINPTNHSLPLII